MAVATGLIDAFAAAAQRSDSEFELALLVAGFINPGLPAGVSQQRLGELVRTLQQQPCEGLDDLLSGMRAQGFGQHALQQVTLQHSHVGWVLEHKQGLPIALAVVLVECARRCGMTGHGVNFPGHFLVQVGEDLVDPLRMEKVSSAQLQGRGLSDAELSQLLQPATPQALGLRMLNNLKSLFVGEQDWQQALDLLDCQLALAHTDSELVGLLHFERGEMWGQIGAVRVAQDAYEACLAATTNTDLASKANARIAGLDGLGETLH